MLAEKYCRFADSAAPKLRKIANAAYNNLIGTPYN
jgi:hypothetical protein